MEGMKNNLIARITALAGLFLLGLGGLFYALATREIIWGLVLALAGLALLVLAGLLNRRSLAKIAVQRQMRMGFGAVIGVLVFLALAVFLGALSSRHHLRIDVSKTGLHTLAPQTIQVLKGLKEPVEALAFFQSVEMNRKETQLLLAQLHYHNKLLSFRFVDPNSDPTLAEKYQINAFGTVVLVAGERHETIKAVDEQNLINALIRVTHKEKKKIYWLTGHGERSLKDDQKDGYSLLKTSLIQQNYSLVPLLLATAKEVPADAAAVVAAGPRKPLAKLEMERLSAYLARGGRLLIMLDPQWDGGLTGWLAGYGVKLGNDVVVDLASQEMGKSPFIPIAAAYGDHEITRPLANTATFFTVARSVTPIKDNPRKTNVGPLVVTSKVSWAETDIVGMQKKAPEFNQGQDKAGPITLAVLAVLPEAKAALVGDSKTPPRGELVVLGDSDFATNQNLGQMGNRDLILNAIAYLAQEADLVALRPKMAGNESMVLGIFQARLVFWMPVVVAPLIFMVIGIVVVLRRRRVA